MNKELIKKYKAEFDHWLNSGKLLAKHYNKGWINYYGEDIWTHSAETLIVIDDEYVKFRKALAEGKIVEFKHPQVGYDEWEIVTPEHLFQSVVPGREYRIKPEEPKFKVGDWVIHNQKFKIVTKVVDGLIDCLDHSPARVMRKDTLELWDPKLGEWCWFHNGTVESLYFYKFHSIIFEGYIADIEHVMTAQIFKYCEPFTGNLPTIIKDN